MASQRWSLDFVHAHMMSGLHFRVFNVVHDVIWECLAAVPDILFSRRSFIRGLDALISRHGEPGMIFSDNGTELTSSAVQAWCGEVGIDWC